jgi:hypothetical protein
VGDLNPCFLLNILGDPIVNAKKLLLVLLTPMVVFKPYVTIPPAVASGEVGINPNIKLMPQPSGCQRPSSAIAADRVTLDSSLSEYSDRVKPECSGQLS